MIGRTAQDFILPEDVELARREMRALRKGSGAGHFRCRYRHKAGHTVPILWTSAWSEVDHRFFFIGRDMTEDDRTQEQLRQAQKMESIGQLTGGIAHDFNNILMVILAKVENLEEEVRDPMVLDQLKDITTATERAASLTRQLLAFSRRQPLRPQSIDINDLVTTTGKLLRRTLGTNIEIDSILGDELWPAQIDRTQLESALVNLCINARDAMPNGGRLLIETVNRTLSDELLDRNSDPVSGDYVMLSVTDFGAGIAPDVLHNVFEPFFTTKGLGKGTGLGLSMVYGFIKQSRGHIRIDSEVGQGTSIRLYLPRSDRGSDRVATPQQKSMPRGSERILVVEDEPQVRASVVQQLRSLGYAVAEAPDGAAGLSAFHSASPSYDLLLTDVVMPGPMNGKKLADEVARQWPRTKVVFMSGYTDDAIGQHGSLGAGVMLLSKPFQKSDLAQILRQALEGPDAHSVAQGGES